MMAVLDRKAEDHITHDGRTDFSGDLKGVVKMTSIVFAHFLLKMGKDSICFQP